MTTEQNWQTICHKNDLVKHSGICALLENEEQIAIFQLNETTAYSVSNWDPIGQANVLSRGIIGDSQGELFVASPLYKQRFSLNTGRCLDDESITIKSYQVRIVEDKVQVSLI
ncbi:nitrite reductase small subunit NirD [Thalassotalea atypica]|uniref:nitrite reductase small subunit NirD n=1 Tax=Thalassotalea atypica TaxID=2054316 RepID=UPI0025743FD5|nr:nitrite reductase small subunit NirD [Thalassotalea atypica]